LLPTLSRSPTARLSSSAGLPDEALEEAREWAEHADELASPEEYGCHSAHDRRSPEASVLARA
jgi:hypothetical protein